MYQDPYVNPRHEVTEETHSPGVSTGGISAETSRKRLHQQPETMRPRTPRNPSKTPLPLEPPTPCSFEIVQLTAFAWKRRRPFAGWGQRRKKAPGKDLQQKMLLHQLLHERRTVQELHTQRVQPVAWTDADKTYGRMYFGPHGVSQGLDGIWDE